MNQLESPPGATTIIGGRKVDYFCGTSYFSLHSHLQVINAACEATHRFGLGSATFRSGYGNNTTLVDVEKRAAQFFNTEDALYFGSGYLGNAILLQELAPQYDVIFIDSESHYAKSDGISLVKNPSRYSTIAMLRIYGTLMPH